MNNERIVVLLALLFAGMWIVTQVDNSNLKQQIFNLNKKIADQNRQWEIQYRRMSSKEFNDFVHVYSLYLRAKERAAHGQESREEVIRQSDTDVRRDPRLHHALQRKIQEKVGSAPAEERK